MTDKARPSSREAQGLPRTIQDPAVIARIVALVAPRPVPATPQRLRRAA